MVNPAGVRLFDCSHHQGTINWTEVAKGHDGVVMKITEGHDYVDPRWSEYYHGAGAVGLARGAYHFADLGAADAEAAHFAAVLGSVTWELLPTGDIEAPGSGGIWTRTWIAGVRRRTGHRWLRIYSSYSLLKSTMDPVGWFDTQCSIWAARYNTILGWDHPGLELWQRTDAADIPGVLGHADDESALHGWHIGVDLARLGLGTGPTPKPAPQPHPTTGKLPAGTVLRSGSTGAAVVALQRTLNAQYPAYSHLIMDGKFGPATTAVVREFQQRAHLSVDGIAGPATLAALHLL